MAAISERLKTAMELRGMKQADIVRATGIGKSSVCTYLAGDYEPKQRNIYKLARALNVSEEWLMGSDVPMERDSTAAALLGAYPLTAGTDKRLLDIGFDLLDDTDKGIIIGEIRNMLRQEKYNKKED